MSASEAFSHAAQWTASQCGRAHTFILACAIIVIWGLTGPIFGYSDTWQLIINTGTTIVTFLMVFLMQNTQNRDTAAIQLKLGELIRANDRARNSMLGLEDLTEEELERLKEQFASLASTPAGVDAILEETHEDLAIAEGKIEAALLKMQDMHALSASLKQSRRTKKPARVFLRDLEGNSSEHHRGNGE